MNTPDDQPKDSAPETPAPLSPIDKVAQSVNGVSKSFCLAKWYQVTLHLQNGHNHSCHHPKTHKTPLDELEKNPSSLHNTNYKKKLRKMMLQGNRPQECAFCWKIEDIPNAPYSDRILKSSEEWALPYLEEAATLPWDADIVPRYVEVAFSSSCNFKCSYCNPSASSFWEAELKELGRYDEENHYHSLDAMRVHDKESIAKEEDNPYIAAFWKWLPDVYSSLHHLRVTGGEPLLSPNTFKLLQYMTDHPNAKIKFALNSNLNPPRARIDKFLEHTSQILDNKAAESVTVYTSLESWGKQAEYMRFGLNIEKFWDNVKAVLESHPRIQLHFMSTFNIFCMESFHEFLERMLELRAKYQPTEPGQGSRFYMDINPLTNPPFLGPNLATPDLLERMKSDLMFMDKHTKDGDPTCFNTAELTRFKRAYAFSKTPPPPEVLAKNLGEFYLFVQEHDRRRNINFANTFPSYHLLLESAKSMAQGELHRRYMSALEREKTALYNLKNAQNELIRSRQTLALSFESKRRLETSSK